MLILLLALVCFLGVSRLAELALSRRHRRELLASGAAPVPEPAFPGMVLLHAGILAGSLIEAVWLREAPPLWLGGLAALGVLAANALRLWAIQSLGLHWNVRVLDSRALGVVARGPYRFIRHPNYVAVYLELALLPLVHAAWLTALVGSALHALVLYRRIRLEERVLHANPAYRRAMAHKPRFLPLPSALSPAPLEGP